MDPENKSGLIVRPPLAGPPRSPEGAPVTLLRYEVLNNRSKNSKYLLLLMQTQQSLSPTSNLLLYPINLAARVQQAINYFGIEPETVLEYHPKGDALIKISLRQLLLRNVDLSGPPSQRALGMLSKQAGLQVASLPEKRESLLDVVARLRLRVSLQDFLTMSQSIRARQFTVCGVEGSQLHVLLKEDRHGLIYQLVMQDSASLRIQSEIRPNSFRSCLGFRRLVMFATGSGIAPFISILRHIAQTGSHEAHLFYGCKSEEDLLFGAQLRQWWEAKVLGSLHVCYSEAQEYLNSRIEEQRERLREWGDSPESCVLICGGTGAAQLIEAALQPAMGLARLRLENRVIRESYG